MIIALEEAETLSSSIQNKKKTFGDKIGFLFKIKLTLGRNNGLKENNMTLYSSGFILRQTRHSGTWAAIFVKLQNLSEILFSD